MAEQQRVALYEACFQRDLESIQQVWGEMGQPDLGPMIGQGSLGVDDHTPLDEFWVSFQGSHAVGGDFSDLIDFLQSKGARISYAGLQIPDNYCLLSVLAEQGLKFDHIQLTCAETDCEIIGYGKDGSLLEALLSPSVGFGGRGRSEELLDYLRPCVAAGMWIYPFDDGSFGPPEEPPQQGPTDSIRKDVIRILWPSAPREEKESEEENETEQERKRRRRNDQLGTVEALEWSDQERTQFLREMTAMFSERFPSKVVTLQAKSPSEEMDSILVSCHSVAGTVLSDMEVESSQTLWSFQKVLARQLNVQVDRLKISLPCGKLLNEAQHEVPLRELVIGKPVQAQTGTCVDTKTQRGE